MLHALAAYGSPEYALTWKRWAIGSGPAICALRASAPRTSGNGSTGWPTAQARDHFPGHSPEYVDEKKAQGHGMANLNDHALLAGWPTPDAQMMNDSADLELHLERLKRLKEKHGNGNGAGMPLGIAAKLAHPPREREREERRAGRPRRPGTTEEPMLPIGGGASLTEQCRLADAQELGRRLGHAYDEWKAEGEVHAPWDDCLLVPCSDGTARRVGRGVFPLAPRVPGRLGQPQSEVRRVAKGARVNRAGRLKGYGNAIVPALAAEFILAAEEALKDLALR